MEIGERLKIARKAIGYTQEKASTESGIGVSSVSEFETSTREPSFSQLSALAEVYKKTIGFFFADDLPPENIMLWRDKPEDVELEKKHEAEFRQLCEQYHRLELCTREVKSSQLPEPPVTKPEEFNWMKVTSFARVVRKSFSLGDVPIASFKRILEEIFFIKIFYLDFSGSSISTVSPIYGPAILLNRKNKQWRRSYDLGHELFHILTWNIYRVHDMDSQTASINEEKLANAFASQLLMPEEPIQEKIQSQMSAQGQITLSKLDDIAREYDVSLDAMICRMASIFKFKKEDTEKYREAAKKYAIHLKPRSSYSPEILPERYCNLAQRALLEGKLSLMQFAKYMNISYRKAQEYLIEDDFREEEISISIA